MENAKDKQGAGNSESKQDSEYQPHLSRASAGIEKCSAIGGENRRGKRGWGCFGAIEKESTHPGKVAGYRITDNNQNDNHQFTIKPTGTFIQTGMVGMGLGWVACIDETMKLPGEQTEINARELQKEQTREFYSTFVIGPLALYVARAKNPPKWAVSLIAGAAVLSVVRDVIEYRKKWADKGK